MKRVIVPLIVLPSLDRYSKSLRLNDCGRGGAWLAFVLRVSNLVFVCNLLFVICYLCIEGEC